jgi:hypothetical protein
MMDRREFVKALCALPGVMLIPLGCSEENDTAALNLSTSPSDSSSAFSKKAFIDSIDSVFSVTHQDYGVVDLRLDTVNDELPINQAEQFSIYLSGPQVPLLEEGNHPVYNDNFGDISLHLQPGEASGGRQHYIAVFSLLFV